MPAKTKKRDRYLAMCEGAEERVRQKYGCPSRADARKARGKHPKKKER